MARKLFVLLLPLFSLLSLNAQSVKKIKHVFFIGNSYTYVNNLPLLIQELADANGDSLYYGSNTIGGYTLFDHAGDANTISGINSFLWDNVVIQAQSQEPAFDAATVAQSTTPYVVKLDSLIHHNNACCITTFYETWGRKYGDASNCGIYPPFCTYTGMQNRLKASYKLFADTTQGIMSPAGEAFRLCRQTDSTINLYQSDYSHPSMEGSYLTACVFYEVLFSKSVLNDTFRAGLPTSTSALLQQIAHTVVNDSLNFFNLGVNNAYAPFTYTGNGLQYQFSSASSGNHFWDFGDGSNSTQNNPAHIYASSQNFTVMHRVANSTCNTDSCYTTLLAGVSHVAETEKKELLIYPVPVTDALYLPFAVKGESYEIISLTGTVCQRSVPDENNSIYLIGLPSGYYFLRSSSGAWQRFIKQ